LSFLLEAQISEKSVFRPWLDCEWPWLAVLTIISTWEMRYLGRCRFASLVLVFDPCGGKTRFQIEEVLDEHRVEHHPGDFKPTTEGLVQLRLTYCQQHRHHKGFLTSLAALPEVREMRCEPPA